MKTIPRHWTPGRWHVVYGTDPMWECRTLGWRRLHLGLFFLRSFPPDGEMFSRAVYSGFWLRIRFWLPWEFE